MTLVSLQKPPGRVRQLEARLVDRLAQQHLAAITSAGAEGESRPSWWRLLAVLVALPVHAVSLALAVGGVVLLATGATWPLRVCGGLLVLAAVSTRPQVERTLITSPRCDGRTLRSCSVCWMMWPP